MPQSKDRFVWVDLEMTGLDPEVEKIVEIATIITESDLTVVAEGPNLVIHQPDEILAQMSPVVVEMHGSSGLTQRIRESKLSMAEAEAQTIAFVREHVTDGTGLLAGNSVWKDRQFIEKQMSGLAGILHYRIIDVSTIKELVRRWYPKGPRAPGKKEAHRALDDIRESLVELAFYREHFLKGP
jgi:oligoribonuclease